MTARAATSAVRVHTARRRYRCDDEPCGRMIERGEQYMRWVAFPNHDLLAPWTVNRMCRACQERRGYIGVITS